MKIPTTVIDVTCPKSREKHFSFQSDELTIFGFPTYAGRIPNKILPFLKENFKGDNSPAIAIAGWAPDGAEA